MRIFINTITLFFMLCSPFSYSQLENFDVTAKKIDSCLLGYRTQECLKILDAELLGKKHLPNNLVLLKALKVEALVQAELYNDALELSNAIIHSPALAGDYKIRVMLQRALLYEILEMFYQSGNELKAVKTIYDNPSVKRNQHYGEYLYRMSSWYRVQKQNNKALYYALESKKFGDSNNYKSVSAVASMLLGFLSNDDKTELFHLKQSIEIWKSFGDNNGLCAIYKQCAALAKKNKDYKNLLKYSDSAIFHGKHITDYDMYSKCFLLKSEYYEHFRLLDSALHYFKKYEVLQKKKASSLEKLKVSQLEFKFALQKEQIKKDELVNDNLRIKENNQNLRVFIAALVLFLAITLVLMSVIFQNNAKIKLQKRDIELANEELSDSVKEKELLFKELHHRVKNNLALIMGLVEFHANEIEDPVYVDKFNALRNRVSSIAIVHREFLASDITNINQQQNIADYADKIVDALISLHSEKIIYNRSIQDINLPINQAVPIGMLLNELISNTIKHARVENHIEIDLDISMEKGVLVISYKDNGSSFQPKKNHSSLGVFIIESMISQLNGHFTRQASHYQIFLNLYEKNPPKK